MQMVAIMRGPDASVRMMSNGHRAQKRSPLRRFLTTTEKLYYHERFVMLEAVVCCSASQVEHWASLDV